MPKSRHRGSDAARFSARRTRPPAEEQNQPWAVSEGNVRAIAVICQGSGAHPNQILNELLSMAIGSSRVLHAQLAFGGLLMQRAAPVSPAPEPEIAAEPDAADDSTAEERLAKLKDLATAPVETLHTETGPQGEAVTLGEITEQIEDFADRVEESGEVGA